MYILNIDSQFIFKTKKLNLNCYSVNSDVWKYLDKLFLKSLWLDTTDLQLKDGICFIDIFKSIFNVEITFKDGRKVKNIKYLSIWCLIDYIEKYATIEQYQKLALSLFTKNGI